tara:strand:- start:4042 stop:4764 length:723 start_codon:yes stop_codon:yes gene_type:complete
MIKSIKTILFNFMVITIIISIYGCRGDVIPNDEDMSSYGWELFKDKDYVQALDWFLTAVREDSSHSDAYRGVGWTMGHLRQADSSAYYFENYINRDSTAFEDKLDFYAGLAFAYNAMGDDANARVYAETYFFGNQNSDIGDPYWCFCEKKDINTLDVRLVLAISEYRLGMFLNSQSSLNELNDFFGYPILNYNYDTAIERAILAEKLSMMRDDIDGSNGDNSLDCNGEGSPLKQGAGYCL